MLQASRVLPSPLPAKIQCDWRHTNSEKNWVPLVHAAQLYMSHSIEPHVVLAVSQASGREAAGGQAAGSQAAGSQAAGGQAAGGQAADSNHSAGGRTVRIAFNTSSSAGLRMQAAGRISGGTPWVRVERQASGKAPILVSIVHTHTSRRYHNYVAMAQAEPPFAILHISHRPLPLKCTPRLIKPWLNSRVCVATGLVFTGSPADSSSTVIVSYGAGDAEALLWLSEWDYFERSYPSYSITI